MSCNDIKCHKGKYTYARIVLDHQPQKEDTNRIHITASGNLIKCDGELSVRSANITTAKLRWNSIISTKNTRYMYLNLSLFYLTANLN